MLPLKYAWGVVVCVRQVPLHPSLPTIGKNTQGKGGMHCMARDATCGTVRRNPAQGGRHLSRRERSGSWVLGQSHAAQGMARRRRIVKEKRVEHAEESGGRKHRCVLGPGVRLDGALNIMACSWWEYYNYSFSNNPRPLEIGTKPC